MKREITQLANNHYDVLVIGAGIHGAAAAWDAALRGLSVALIDQGDFGSGTSQNSLKIIHGGLRYLQDGNLKRARTMAAERTTWMKIAPHLVHPLTCIMPSSDRLSRNRYILTAALKLNDLISYDRNRLGDPEKTLQSGRVISREEVSQWMPEVDSSKWTGAAIWHDALVHSSERLLLSFVISAAQAGASVANYVEATGFLRQGTRVSGVTAVDRLSGKEFEIRAKVVLNCSGVWIDSLLDKLGAPGQDKKFIPSVAINLVARQLWTDYAVGLQSHPVKGNGRTSSRNQGQLFFIVPWRGYSLIGTRHIIWPHPPDTFNITEEMIAELIEDVNTALHGPRLSREDIFHVHCGFLPVTHKAKETGQVKLVREGIVTDHEQDGIGGLITVTGVKYTTARVIAEQAVDLAVKKLGIKADVCQTHKSPLWGGAIDSFDDFLSRVTAENARWLSGDVCEHLVYTYGSEYGCILETVAEEPKLGEKVTENLPILKAEVIHAVRSEMAQTLLDVVQRRTELGSAGLPEYQTLRTCAELMGKELGWNYDRIQSSIIEVQEAYPWRLLDPVRG
jgi:glycerol-3-phosphate dehydrogenase